MVSYDAYKQFNPGSAAEARAFEVLEILLFHDGQCYDGKYDFGMLKLISGSQPHK